MNILAPELPELPGVLSAEMLRRSGEFILRHQSVSGAIPWWSGGLLDPWDHVEAAMGLSAVGHLPEAAAAYRWLGRTQGADGSWPMEQVEEQVRNASSDTNQCAYLAAGLWHYHLVSNDTALLQELWPTLDAAMGFVLRYQLPGGEIAWAVNELRVPDDFALLTGSSSILHALACAVEIAKVLGHQRPQWLSAGDRLHQVLAERPEVFADRGRYSMDWYYPVLGGALREEAGWSHLKARWKEFVWAGFGVRCVADRPWVTAAESAELVIALDTVGRSEEAVQVLSELSHLRDEQTGGYWTGYVVDDEALWPEEQTTWTAAAVILAADAVSGITGGSGIFRDYAWVPARERDDAAR